jgi:hypothetical protein
MTIDFSEEEATNLCNFLKLCEEEVEPTDLALKAMELRERVEDLIDSTHEQEKHQ